MDENLKEIAPILEAFRRIALDPATYRQSIDVVDRQFSQGLLDETSKHSRLLDDRESKVRQMGQAVLHALRPPKTSQELLDYIKSAYELSDRQLRLLKDIGIVATDATGRLIVRSGPDIVLKQEKAVIYLFAIGFLLGMAIWSIALEPVPGAWLLVRGIGLGMAIGSIAGFVLSRSFRAYPVLEKLKMLEPWVCAGRAHWA